MATYAQLLILYILIMSFIPSPPPFQVWAALPPGHPSGGSLCDLVVLPSREVQPRPIGVDEAGAAALPYSGLLALHALRRQCGVRMGETPAVPTGFEQGGRCVCVCVRARNLVEIGPFG